MFFFFFFISEESSGSSFATSTPLPYEASSPPDTPNLCDTPITSRQENRTPLSVNLAKNNGPSTSFPPLDRNGTKGPAGATTNVKASNFTGLSGVRPFNIDDDTLASSFDLKTESDAMHNDSLRIYYHPVIPFFLAILVCFFFSCGFSEVVFGSLVVPFLLYELQHMVWIYWNCASSVQQQGKAIGFLGTALVLCGLPHEFVTLNIEVLNSLRNVGSDFAVYFVTVVLWHSFLGGLVTPQEANVSSFSV